MPFAVPCTAGRPFPIPRLPCSPPFPAPPGGSIAAALLVVWFSGIAVRKLQHPDEGRYAEIAREMAASGDWVTPRLNGLKYFEKPPFQYWATAAAFKTFGVREWTARLVPALAGLLAVAIVGMTAVRLDGPTTGVYAALVLAGCFWHFALSQLLTLDSVLSAWLAAALCAFLLAQRDGLTRGRLSQLDARRLRRGRRRDADQGTGGTGDSGRNAGPLHAGDARRRPVEAPARAPRIGGLPAVDRALVPAGIARQPGIRAVLLHPRAFRALPDERAPTRGQLVLLRAAVPGGNASLAAGLAWTLKRSWRNASDRGERLFLAEILPGLGAVRVRVLQLLRFQAPVLHPADVSGAGAGPWLAADATAVADPRAAGAADGDPVLCCSRSASA